MKTKTTFSFNYEFFIICGFLLSLLNFFAGNENKWREEAVAICFGIAGILYALGFTKTVETTDDK